MKMFADCFSDICFSDTTKSIPLCSLPPEPVNVLPQLIADSTACFEEKWTTRSFFSSYPYRVPRGKEEECRRLFSQLVELAPEECGNITFGEEKHTLLTVLIMAGFREQAKLVIERKLVDVNQKSLDGKAPLHWSAWMGEEELTRLLIEAGADVNMFYEVPQLRERVKTVLVQDSKDPEKISVTVAPRNILTPLVSALDGYFKMKKKSCCPYDCARYLRVARLLLARGANPNFGVFSADGEPLLTFMLRDHELVLNTYSESYLVHEKSSDRREYNENLLGLVRLEKSLISDILNAGYDPETVGALTRRPLHFASTQWDPWLFDELISRKVELNSLCWIGLFNQVFVTPLHLVVLNCGKESIEETCRRIRVLHKNGAECNIRSTCASPNNSLSDPKNLKNLTPFQMAVYLDKPLPVIEALLEWDNVEMKTKGRVELGLYANPGERQNLNMLLEAYRVMAKGSKIETNCSDFMTIFSETQQPRVISKAINTSFSKNICQRTIAPLIDVLKTQARRGFPLKVFCMKTKWFVAGEFDCLNSANIYLSDDIFSNSSEALSTLIHEMTHKVMQVVFNFRCVPYSSSQREKQYHECIQKDLEHLQTVNVRYSFVVKREFERVAKLYPQRAHDAEYIVRIPQLVMKLAMRYDLTEEQIDQVLCQTIPHTYRYYQKVVIPACQRFCRPQEVTMVKV